MRYFSLFGTRRTERKQSGNSGKAALQTLKHSYRMSADTFAASKPRESHADAQITTLRTRVAKKEGENCRNGRLQEENRMGKPDKKLCSSPLQVGQRRPHKRRNHRHGSRFGRRFGSIHQKLPHVYGII